MLKQIKTKIIAMIESINSEKAARKLVLKAQKAILSLWNSGNGTFIQNSKESDALFHPTATFHAIIALISSNSDFKEDEEKKKKKEIDDKILKKILENSLSKLISKSSHNTKGKGLRKTIVLVEMCHMLWLISDLITDKVQLKKHLIFIDSTIKKIIDENQKELTREPGTSPLALVNVVLCIKFRNLIKKDEPKYSEELDVYERCLFNHINFHMARAVDYVDFSFDSNSLATALCGYCTIQPHFKKEPFYRSCLKVIVNSQNLDGCWPCGISVSFSENQDVNPLPSVEIATFIVESLIDEDSLIEHSDETIETLQVILPGLRKFAKYLEVTYQEKGERKGWFNDRIGIKDQIDTWITALACRFLYGYWIAEKALLRSLSLKKLGVNEYHKQNVWDEVIIGADNVVTLQRKIGNQDDKTIIVDPDSVVTPTKQIYSEYLKPIIEEKQTKKQQCIYRPQEDNVSFILFGPPGSGKTYLVNQISEALDWPIIELSPGHFIKDGLELIESTAKEIFDLISNINHAIVLLDECDELFRKRPIPTKNSDNTRTILSFATASMLPKLQTLHDDRNVIFILGTNYLQNIDDAIRRPGRFDDIILYDRPDENARRTVIQEYIARKKMTIAEDIVEKLTADSMHFSIKELNQSIKNNFRPIENSSKEDYCDWCEKIGKVELQNSRYNDDEKRQICKRWDTNKSIIQKIKHLIS
jgi:AAA+ superfamily predicted ATPase